MIRLFLSLVFLVIACSNPFISEVSEEDCECVFEIKSTLPSVGGVYQLEFNNNLRQTYSVLDITTECGWAQHIMWESDYMYQIGTDWVSLVNPSSMTDEYGDGQVVFAVWEEFIGYTVTIYGAYIDDCGHNLVDSVKVRIVDNE